MKFHFPGGSGYDGERIFLALISEGNFHITEGGKVTNITTGNLVGNGKTGGYYAVSFKYGDKILSVLTHRSDYLKASKGTLSVWYKKYWYKNGKPNEENRFREKQERGIELARFVNSKFNSFGSLYYLWWFR